MKRYNDKDNNKDKVKVIERQAMNHSKDKLKDTKTKLKKMRKSRTSRKTQFLAKFRTFFGHQNLFIMIKNDEQIFLKG